MLENSRGSLTNDNSLNPKGSTTPNETPLSSYGIDQEQERKVSERVLARMQEHHKSLIDGVSILDDFVLQLYPGPVKEREQTKTVDSQEVYDFTARVTYLLDVQAQELEKLHALLNHVRKFI